MHSHKNPRNSCRSCGLPPPPGTGEILLASWFVGSFLFAFLVVLLVLGVIIVAVLIPNH